MSEHYSPKFQPKSIYKQTIKSAIIQKENWDEVIKMSKICKKIKDFRANSWEEIQKDIKDLSLQNQPSTSGYKPISPKM